MEWGQQMRKQRLLALDSFYQNPNYNYERRNKQTVIIDSGEIGATATATRDAFSGYESLVGGSNYTTHAVSFSGGGGGTGAAATAVASTIVAGDAVASVTVTAGGDMYLIAPTISFSGGGGTGATATAVLLDMEVHEINVTDGGSGYTSAPTVNIHNDGSHTGTEPTTATAALSTGSGGVIQSLTITNKGSGYTSAPTISFAGGGSGASVTALIQGVSTAGITITNAGKGYTSAPVITFVGDGSSLAASATLSGDTVGSIAVSPDSEGDSYTSDPTVLIAAPTTVKFTQSLIEPLIVDKLSDVFLDNLTTFDCLKADSNNEMGFILDIEELNIHSASNKQELAFGKVMIPNVNTGTPPTTDVHKSKKINYICSINPCKLRTLTCTLTLLDGSSQIFHTLGARYIAELVIIPRK